LDVLLRIAEGLKEAAEHSSALDKSRAAARVHSLTDQFPPLPHFSRFHEAFTPDNRSDAREGDMRAAFFLAYDRRNCEHLHLDGSIRDAMKAGRTLVSASFVTPYPPGFPILVPGQVISADILAYLRALDVKEIHGYDRDHGLRVFTEEALALPL
jgi:arginine decarboxylase